jgi:cellulose synthase/poly-beta-1,6-N-acetylglucosamine synthase-like glycosyltransferase
MQLKGLFWLSLALVFYTYVGYPLMVVLLGRLFRRRVAQGPCEPAVTIIIAAFNEARHLRATIENKLALDYPPGKLQIVIVSDGSTDGTDAIAESFASPSVLVLRQDPRRGKTAALNAAVRHATGEILVFADANSSYAPSALRILMRNFADPIVGYATGRMVYEDRESSGTGLGCRAYMAYEDLLRRSETRLGSIVGVNGGIDAVRRQLYVEMRDDHLPDFVLPLAVVDRGYRVVYEPGAILREETLSSGGGEYRMRVRVALRAWWTLKEMRRLFDVRRHGFFAWQLLSHKALRYLMFAAVPVWYGAALALLATSALYALAAAGGTLVLLLAAAGFVIDRRGGSAWPCSIPYYFLLVNAASAQALCEFLRGRRRTIWTPRLG